MNAPLQNVVPIQSNQNYSLAPRNFEEAERLAKIIADSGICPSGLRGRPSDVLVILQMGHELNLQPMQALRTLGCINGLPFAYGDGFLALIKRHKDFIDIKEWIEGTIENGDAVAHCTMTRRNQEPQTRRFSIKDAKRAKLWEKGVWALYPQRMLQHRARTYAGKDVFPDAVFGLMTEDEARNVASQEVIQVSPQNKGNAGLKETLKSKVEEVIQPDIIEGDYQAAHSEEHEALINELQSLILEKDIKESSIDKWRKRFNVDLIQDIPTDSIKKIINHIKEKM